VVEYRDTHERTDIDHALGELDIGLARRGISARMVVDQDDGVRTATNSLGEQLAGMDVDLGQAADGHAEHVDDALARIEQDGCEELLGTASQNFAKKSHERGRAVDGMALDPLLAATVADANYGKGGPDLPRLFRRRAQVLERAQGGILEPATFGKRVQDRIGRLLANPQIHHALHQAGLVAELDEQIVGRASHVAILPRSDPWYDGAVIDAKEAAIFNASVRGKLWDQSELPPPYCSSTALPADGEAFAYAISAFQILVGLTVDGKLGTDTLGALRTVHGTVTPELGEGDAERDLEIPEDVPPPALTPRLNVSNCLRIGGKSVPLPKEMVEAGISCSNFADDGDHHFRAVKRRQPCRWFVFHESVSMSAKKTIATLEAKTARSAKSGKNYLYGVHLINAPDGHFSCHADLLDETIVHANQLNKGSVGCEWVNPYNPAWAKHPFDRVIPAPWWCWVPRDKQPLYTLPTPAQLLAAEWITRFLPTVIPDLPLAFPTTSLGPGKGRIKNWNKRALPGAGFVAHRDFSDHADGRYLLEHVMQKMGATA
jgi:hypothetical protein